ncbi:IS66 family insertion sequence element accessory protein TnpA [Budvicia aquatica]|uniref:IS66 family insertion sequence element accessory protein TnpB n=1 Tax=Budvicia aquatica TaxID=82979 RepID=A0A2C6CTU8_9GAMM|nr:hypothetical protein [Budvicia aquatica]PHI30069.1 IS66 family insertion sequence hypothetical protein [Budvicia aquatica]VFS49056.1 Uncharacterised protein [Budvicia aquatica]
MSSSDTIEQRKQHINDWRTSRLTRQQYCQQHGISVNTFKGWNKQVNRGEKDPIGATALLPVQIRQNATPSVAPTDPVMVYLPGGCRVACQPGQLTDVFRALKYAEA